MFQPLPESTFLCLISHAAPFGGSFKYKDNNGGKKLELTAFLNNKSKDSFLKIHRRVLT